MNSESRTASAVRRIKPALLTTPELIAQAMDYFSIADQDNLDTAQKDRLRRAASAMVMCATSGRTVTSHDDGNK